MLSGFRTFIGIVIAAVPTFADLLGFTVAPGFTEQATSLAGEILTIVGLCIAAYGRLKAEVPGWLARR